MQTATYREVQPDFGHWLAGFIDGEGCFVIQRHARPAPRVEPHSCRFALVLRDDDTAIIDEIVAATGIGYAVEKAAQETRTRRGHAQREWAVRRKADCGALVSLIDRFPLRSKKARDYAIWRAAVLEWSAFTRRADGWAHGTVPYDWRRMSELKAELEAIRRHPRETLRAVSHGALRTAARGCT